MSALQLCSAQQPALQDSCTDCRTLLPRVQELAEEAGGENLLVVTHWDGISASVTRLLPWALVYPVLHTGWTVGAPTALLCY